LGTSCVRTCGNQVKRYQRRIRTGFAWDGMGKMSAA
jgi:hypothetical protein